jgi:hypothetical protein
MTIKRLLAATKKLSSTPQNSTPQRKKGFGRPRKVTEDVLFF